MDACNLPGFNLTQIPSKIRLERPKKSAQTGSNEFKCQLVHSRQAGWSTQGESGLWATILKVHETQPWTTRKNHDQGGLGKANHGLRNGFKSWSKEWISCYPAWAKGVWSRLMDVGVIMGRLNEGWNTDRSVECTVGMQVGNGWNKAPDSWKARSLSWLESVWAWGETGGTEYSICGSRANGWKGFRKMTVRAW